MNHYHYVYRLEQGLSPAEQRAADQAMGELAAALDETRHAIGGSLRRRLTALKALSRINRTREQTSGAAAALAGR